jgi:hypothetical protein
MGELLHAILFSSADWLLCVPYSHIERDVNERHYFLCTHTLSLSLSIFSLSFPLYIFSLLSPLSQAVKSSVNQAASSREIGRYLQGIPLDGSNALVQLKKQCSSLRSFLERQYRYFDISSPDEIFPEFIVTLAEDNDNDEEHDSDSDNDSEMEDEEEETELGGKMNNGNDHNVQNWKQQIGEEGRGSGQGSGQRSEQGSGDDDSEEYSAERLELELLTVKALQARLKAMSLPISGVKTVLIDRLVGGRSALKRAALDADTAPTATSISNQLGIGGNDSGASVSSVSSSSVSSVVRPPQAENSYNRQYGISSYGTTAAAAAAAVSPMSSQQQSPMSPTESSSSSITGASASASTSTPARASSFPPVVASTYSSEHREDVSAFVRTSFLDDEYISIVNSAKAMKPGAGGEDDDAWTLQMIRFFLKYAKDNEVGEILDRLVGI